MFGLLTKKQLVFLLCAAGNDFNAVVRKAKDESEECVLSMNAQIQHDQSVISSALERIERSKAELKQAQKNLSVIAELTA